MVALRERDRSGKGQVVDVNLLESMVQLMSALPSAAAHLDYDQPRLGSGIPYSVPRGTYRCADGEWVAISTSAESVAHRVMTLLGVGDDPRFATFESRAEPPRGARRGSSPTGSARGRFAEVLAAFDAAEAAIAPVYSMRDLLDDPHVRRARRVRRGGRRRDAGSRRASAADARVEVRFVGRPLGADTDAVLDAL